MYGRMHATQDIATDLLPTRKTLVRKLGDVEDQESWREFFETYWRLIYNFAIKSGCTEMEAEEVVQETVISVARKMPEFKYQPRVCSFKGWLMHVANWRVIDQLRKRNHRIAEVHEDGPGSTGTEPLHRIADPLGGRMEALWQQEWEENLVETAVERVKRRCNPEYYQIFYLLIVKKREMAEVMKALGVSRAQVYVAKHRIGTMVKREVKELERKML